MTAMRDWAEAHSGMLWLTQHPFGTHLPVLLQCLIRTYKSPVLELGMGEYSTPFLHLFAKDRWVVSVDHDPDIFDVFSKKYASPKHKFMLLKDYDFEPIPWWGIVLIDRTAGKASSRFGKAGGPRCFFNTA